MGGFYGFFFATRRIALTALSTITHLVYYFTAARFIYNISILSIQHVADPVIAGIRIALRIARYIPGLIYG